MFYKKYLFFLFFSILINAQKNIDNQQLIWYGYYNQMKFNDNWSLSSEVQERHFYKPIAQHQFILRTNIERKIFQNTKATFGLVYFLNSPNEPDSEINLQIPELRADIGVSTRKKYQKFIISHRYKLEARFFHQTENDRLVGGYQFSNFRMRYMLGIDIPIRSKSELDQWTLKIKDEVMFNFGKNIVKNIFDQNRIYLGINHQMSKNLAIEAGYLNWFQQRSSGSDFYNRDIIRLSVFHTLNFKNN